LAERSAWTGFRLTWLYMLTAALLFLTAPELFLFLFQGDLESGDPSQRAQVAAVVPIVLRFVAVYSLFDAINLIFSFALRGAGDTRFVSLFSLALSWPLMVVPTYLTWKFNWGPSTARWTFRQRLHIIALAVAFLLLRFLGRQMEVDARYRERGRVKSPTAGDGANSWKLLEKRLFLPARHATRDACSS